MDDYKQLVSKLENINLHEAPFDFVSTAKNSLDNLANKTAATFGSNKAKGRDRRNTLADRMIKSWYEWIGATSRQGNLNDLEPFLINKVGFTKNEADILLSKEKNILDRDVENDNQESTPEVDKPIDTNTDTTKSDASKEDIKNQPKETPEKDIELDTDSKSELLKNPPEDTDDEKIIVDYSKDLQKLMNRNNKNIYTKSNFSSMLSTSKDIQQMISRRSEDISDFTRLYGANTVLDCFDFILSNVDNVDSGINNDKLRMLELQRGKVNNFIKALKNKLEIKESIIKEDILDYENSEIPKSDIINFFRDAASYAIENNLIGRKTTPNSGNVSNSQKTSSVNSTNSSDRGSGQNYRPMTDQEREDKKFERRVDKTWDKASSIGLSSNDIQDIKDLALSTKFQKITDKGDINDLAAVGWAFLRSLG